MQYAFQLASPLGAADAGRLTLSLANLPGVHAIHAAPGSDRFEVSFDEDTISLQAIAAAAERAGYRERPAVRAGCCGGCCGS